jgi:hypothetical protein
MFVYPWGEGELAGYTGPQPWQREVLQAIGLGIKTLEEAVQIAIASGHGIGKTALVAWIIKWALDTFPDTRGKVTANTAMQLSVTTWAELAKWHRLSITSHWFTYTATSIHSSDPAHEKTWRIDAEPWSKERSEAFQGLHNHGKRVLLIFDEASAIDDKIWEVAEGALTDKDTEIIWCAFGNPTRNTGRFRECFGRFHRRWLTKQIDSREVAISNKAQLQQWIEDYGIDSDFVKVRVRGMFPSTSAKQFISVEDVDAAYGRHLREEQYAWAPKILTCDPAWSGDDELVIGLRQGLAFRILRVMPKNDNDVQVANILANLEDEEKADAVFIDGGYGTGIVSAGQTMGRNWTLVWFSEAATNPAYANKRAEMWGLMKQWLKQGGAIPRDQVLYNDLIGPEVHSRLDDKIQLEPKETMKKRGLLSPNRADALALSFAHPVQAKGLAGSKGGQVKHEFNPLERG